MKAQARTKHDEYDDRVAKAQGTYQESLRASPEGPSRSISPPSNSTPPPEGFPPDLPTPEPLTTANAKLALSLERFAGEYVAQCFYSMNWHLREAALVYVESKIDQLIVLGQEREQFRTLCAVVVRGLKDKVPNVFLTSTSLIETIVHRPNIHSKDAQLATSDFVPILIDKLGETNPRIRDAAHEAIMTLAKMKDSSMKSMTGLFLKPLKKRTAWRPILGRLETMSELIDLFGIGKGVSGSFDLDPTMAFVAKAFMSPNGDVRSSAITVAVRVAKIVGPLVKRYIPDDVNPKVREQLDLDIAAALNSPSQPSPKLITETPKKVPKNKQPNTIPENVSEVECDASPSSFDLQNELEDPSVYESELKKQEQLLGTDHPDLTEVLTNLAASYTQDEKLDLAYSVLKRVLDINEKHFGPDDSSVAHALTDLAVLHLEQVE